MDLFKEDLNQAKQRRNASEHLLIVTWSFIFCYMYFIFLLPTLSYMQVAFICGFILYLVSHILLVSLHGLFIGFFFFFQSLPISSYV